MRKAVSSKLEFYKDKEEGIILINNIEPFLSTKEIIGHIENNIMIDNEKEPVAFDKYVEQAKFAEPYKTSLKPGNCYQAMLITGEHNNAQTFNHSISMIKNLGYFEATLMDCLHILSLSSKKVQGYENYAGQPIANFAQYLLAPGTVTDKKVVEWSLMPRLRIKGNFFLDSMTWRNLSHYPDHAVIAIKEIK